MTPEAGNHCVCYCDDCQAFARFLGRDDILDEQGGTEIFQTTPARIHLTGGVANLRCMRLSEKGLHRWYAGCCRTPVGNTLGKARVPFVGLLHPFLGDGTDGRPRDAIIGPIIERAYGRFAIGGMPPDAREVASLGFILRAARKILHGFVTGEYRPSPFFDLETGKPVVVPEVLGPEERARLTASGGAVNSPTA
jgi:hypothetical protein